MTRYLLHNYLGCGPEVINLCFDGKAEQLDELLAKNISFVTSPPCLSLPFPPLSPLLF
jgi:hypothetical protein